MHTKRPANIPTPATYNIGPISAMTLDAWLEGPSPQCLVVRLPIARIIGEDDFLLDVAHRRCGLRGFKDSLSRHFISRRFSASGSPQEAEAFLDQARAAAEITDDFMGLDALDMTEWLTARMAGERWQAFIRYLQTSPSTDFVLLSRTTSEERIEALVRTVSQGGCLMTDVVELYAPTGQMLAQYMTRCAALPAGLAEKAADAFESLRAQGAEPNYVLARDIALRVAGELKRGLAETDALVAAFSSRGITFGYCK